MNDSTMTIRGLFARLAAHEGLNFLVTNCLFRQSMTRFMGWFSRIEQPLVCAASIAAWRLFADLDLRDARKDRFASLHECFTRELKPGARSVDAAPEVMVSPCDGIVGACGPIDGVRVIQAKGFPYTLLDLLGDPLLLREHVNGHYITLRLTSSMYHRFHAPHDCRVERVDYISGDTWNVNPVALQRVDKLFCKNERAVIRTRLAATGHVVTLVPVAAVLVASIRLHCLEAPLNLRYRGPNLIPCDARYAKGEEMGYFEHGSTIIVFVPAGFELCGHVREGTVVRMGEPLLRLPARGQV
jgi:phosphatidylserine decarboxylase